MKYLNYSWKSRSGLLKIPGKTGLASTKNMWATGFLRSLLCWPVFLSLHVWKGNYCMWGTRSHQAGVLEKPDVDYRWAVTLYLGDLSFQIARTLVQCWSFGAHVILSFIEIVLNSHNLEFNLLVLPLPQGPESWDGFCLKVWVTAECSVPMSLQLELLGMAQGFVISQWQGERLLWRPCVA